LRLAQSLYLIVRNISSDRKRAIYPHVIKENLELDLEDPDRSIEAGKLCPVEEDLEENFYIREGDFKFLITLGYISL